MSIEIVSASSEQTEDIEPEPSGSKLLALRTMAKDIEALWSQRADAMRDQDYILVAQRNTRIAVLYDELIESLDKLAFESELTHPNKQHREILSEIFNTLDVTGKLV